MDDRYFNLGDYHRSISTSSKTAQRWFNRGLVWCYGFNQEEAVRCFKRAVEYDPECAMAYWGIAYASGPFYNKPWHWYGEQERHSAIALCHENAHKAKALNQNTSPLEQALIEALCQKHPLDQCNDSKILPSWNTDYANAMRQVRQDYPHDLEVLCLCAEAIMNLTPWQLWDLKQAIPAKDAGTEEAIEILEHGLSIIQANGLLPHPGILHFYIHVYEMSPTPEKALPCANQLRNLCPDCGHLRHMASHIDGLCGNWLDAADANDKAIAADTAYMERRGSDEFYLISIVHNYHFRIWAAMFLGQYQNALDTADQICELVRDKRTRLEKNRYLASTLDGYYAGRAHVLVRFGKWQAICDEAMPTQRETIPITTIYLVYAKAIAFAALGDLETADLFRQDFKQRYQLIPEWHVMANNPTRNILAVAQAMMNGEVEYHAGNYELGFQYLREATKLSDELCYSEPWPWMHPPRHALGALLLEQNQTDEAITHYEDDLGIGNRLPRCVQHPNNIWALHGYHECLKRLGRLDEIAATKPVLDDLIRLSDIKITSSCCCRKQP